MAQSFVGSGDIYLDRLTSAGVGQGFVRVGAGKFEIKSDADIKEQVSRGKNTYGQVMATVAINKPATVTIQLTQVDRSALAIAFLGTDVTYNTTSGTVTDEVITALTDKYVRLAHRNVSDVVVTNNTATITYVNGVDYELVKRIGMIKALSTGAITNLQELKVDYSYNAEQGYKIQGATQPLVRMSVFFDGRNLVDGSNCFVTVYEAQVAPDSGIDFLQNDFADITLKGKMVTPAGKAEPFVVEIVG